MRTFKTTIVLIALLTFSSSCENFLSEVPDNRTQIDTPEKISELLVYAYPNGNYMEFAETMTDNVADSRAVLLTNEKNSINYSWGEEKIFGTDSQAFYWDACYTAIAHANQAIEAIKKLGNPASLNPQKGEALLARAYAHFMLVSFWAQGYNPATAAKDLGIPYVTTPEDVLIKKYTRNSVAEVFDFIQKDLEEGMKYVTDNYKQPKFHFTKAAAQALASRFYLIKGDWNKVIEVSNDLGNKPVGYLRDYQSYLDVDFNTRQRKYSLASEPTNLLIATVNSVYLRSFYSNRFQLNDSNRGEILGTGTNLFNKAWKYETLSYNSNVTIFIPKVAEYFKITNASAGIGLPFVTPVLLSNDELFLNRIEAHIMTNQIAIANSELEYFISTRTQGYNPNTDKVTETLVVNKYPVVADEYTPFYNLTPLQTSYIKALAELRRKDFIHEGLRWFDIKRFRLKITHKYFDKPDDILLKDDKRKALQIPSYVSDSGVEKNPR
jgi:hypothetical protein